ncbi:hypothetical protein U1Q18_009338 [Sarracenia purpurea var. burkii]
MERKAVELRRPSDLDHHRHQRQDLVPDRRAATEGRGRRRSGERRGRAVTAICSKGADLEPTTPSICSKGVDEPKQGELVFDGGGRWWRGRSGVKKFLRIFH